MKKTILIVLALVVAGGIAFQTLGGMTWLDSMGLRGEQRLVEQRVKGYWSARVQNDASAMAQYLHPLQTTMTQAGMLVTEGFEIKEIAVDGDNAAVVVAVSSRLKHPQMSSRTRERDLHTTWVRYDGAWYRGLAPSDIKGAIQFAQGTWQPPTAPETGTDATQD